jgi:transposase
VLLVAQGMTCPEVAHFLGDAPRSVEYWVGRLERDGFLYIGPNESHVTDIIGQSSGLSQSNHY